MAEAMEHRVENRIEKLLRGTAAGSALALRGCPEEAAANVAARFGAGVAGRVRLLEPCRTEHPHSAFLRKSIEAGGAPAIQTTLFAPTGRLVEERPQGGDAVERFVKKPEDFEVLQGFLKDVELCPAKAALAPEDCTSLAFLGLTPVREMETRWAGLELTAWALAAQDEPAASCLRKLERHLHRRCEEAHRLGYRAGLLRDMAAVPLPETYMLHAGRHIDWIRHAGIAPYVEVTLPEPKLLAALAAAGAGARISLTNPALYGPSFFLPEGMRLLMDADARKDLGDMPKERIKNILAACGSTVILLDCYQAEEEQVFKTVEALLEVIAK